MNNFSWPIYLLVLFLSYIFYLAVWGFICFTTYYLSLITKKLKIMTALVGISQIVSIIFYILITIYFIYLGYQLIITGQWIILLILILLGFGLIRGIFSFLALPFNAIPIYFLNKLESIDLNEEVVSAELLDDKGKVVQKTEGDLTVQRRFGKYLIASLIINLVLLLFYSSRYNPVTIEYITLPIYWTVSNSFFIAIPVIVFNLIKYRKIKGRGWYYSMINILRIEIIVSVVPPILATLYLLISQA